MELFANIIRRSDTNPLKTQLFLFNFAMEYA